MWSSFRALKIVARLFRIGARSFSQSTKPKTNQSTQATIETLYAIEGKRVRLLTFPAHPLIFDAPAMNKLDLTFKSAIPVFCLDPLKVLKLQRSIYNHQHEKVYKTKATTVSDSNIITLVSPFESVFDSKLFETLIRNEVNDEGIRLEMFLKIFSDLFLCDWDLYLFNPNINEMLKYLVSASKATQRIAFGSFPEPLFRAKLSELVSKDDIFNSYLNLLKNLAKSHTSGQSVISLFGDNPGALSRLLFALNTQMVKSKYFWEYSKAIAQNSEDDVVLVADPLTRKHVKTLQFVDQQKSHMGPNPDKCTRLVNFLEYQFESRLKDIFGESEIDQMAMAVNGFESDFPPRDADSFPLTRHPNDFSFLESSFKEVTRIQSLEVPDSTEAKDKLFIMAFLDLLHNTNLLESEFVDHKFFYINPEKNRFSDAQNQDLEKRFYLNYNGIQKVRDKLFEDIEARPNPQSPPNEENGLKYTFQSFSGLIDLDESGK